MRTILFLAIISFVIPVSFSQDDYEYFAEDSVHIKQFLQQVDHIELCELGLSCYIDTTYIDDTDERKAVTKCHLDGAIRYPKIDFSKITCKEIVSNKEDLFQILISSTKNTSHERGICYEPRNGVLFFDKGGTLLGYLEICFACGHTATLFKLGSMDFTSDQYREMETFFNKNGIKTK